jgi:hypothetical protein
MSYATSFTSENHMKRLVVSAALLVGYGLCPARPAYAAPVVIQKNHAAGAASPVASTWTQATVTGNFLLAVIGSNTAMGTITPPASQGWTEVSGSPGGTGPEIHIFFAANANSVSGSSSWTYTGTGKAGLLLAEVSGIAASSPQDATAVTSTGTNANPATGNYTTTVALEYLVAGFCFTSTAPGAPSNPTNSFTLEDNVAASTTQQDSWQDRYVTSSGTYSTGYGPQGGSSPSWASIIVGFKATNTAHALPSLGVGGLTQAPNWNRRKWLTERN